MTRAIRHRPARALILGCLLWSACADRPRWNVLLVTLDTTRADRIGDYGDGNHTPRLDALAADGVRFAHAYTAIPITAPSHSTMLTGKYPIAHGVRDNGLFVLEERQTTMAEVLRDHGYATAGAIAAYPLVEKFGFSQGFDHWDDDLGWSREDLFGRAQRDEPDLFFDDRPASQVNAALLPWLREHADRPFFVWAHYFDPHQPYRPKPPYDQLLIGDPYRAEIAYADASFGTLLDEIEALGALDSTVVIVTADHGEGLGEHLEATHSMLLYNSTLHVPLIVRVPGVAGGTVVDQRVGTVDLLPTVLDLLGIDRPPGVQGRSLAPLLLEGRELPEAPLYAETLAPRLAHRWGALRAWISGDDKYIFGPRPELFDLATDSNELDDLVDHRPEEAERLQRRLADFLQREAVEGLPGPAQMDAETKERLAALGYLSSGGAVEEPIEDRLDPSGAPPQDRVVDISRLSKAKDLLYQGRPLEARLQIEELLAGSPHSPYYRELLASAEFALGNIDLGLEIVRELRDTHANPRLLAAHALNGAQIALRSGRPEIADRLAAESLALHPTAPAEHVRARAAAEAGRDDDYLQGLEAAIELDPDWVAARIDLAVELLRRGEREAAATHLEQAIRQYPFHAPAHVAQGRLALESGRPAEGLRSLQRAVELEPSYLPARVALIRAFATQGMTGSALAELEQLEHISPGSPETAAARRWIEARVR